MCGVCRCSGRLPESLLHNIVDNELQQVHNLFLQSVAGKVRKSTPR